MRRSILLASLLSLAFLPLAYPQVGVQDPPSCPSVINTSGQGTVVAKPDIAVVFMAVRSSAGIAADALVSNQKKEAEIEQRLRTMGLKEKFQFSGNRFGPSGPPNYGQPRTGVTGFDVTEYVYVFLDVAGFQSMAQLEKRIGEVIDELTRAGASAVDTQVPRLGCQQSTCTVAFAVKDASKYVQQATEEATRKARSSGQAIARSLNVEIAGLRSVHAGAAQYYGQPQGSNPLDDLSFEFWSASAQSVPVSATVNMQFTTK